MNGDNPNLAQYQEQLQPADMSLVKLSRPNLQISQKSSMNMMDLFATVQNNSYIKFTYMVHFQSKIQLD